MVALAASAAAVSSAPAEAALLVLALAVHLALPAAARHSVAAQHLEAPQPSRVLPLAQRQQLLRRPPAATTMKGLCLKTPCPSWKCHPKTNPSVRLPSLPVKLSFSRRSERV